MGQQYQVESFHGCIPCSLQNKTSLLAWTAAYASLCSSSSVCFKNPQQHSSVNLLAILVGTGILVVWAWVSGGIYRNWCLDALEGSFALNLITLAAATSYVNQSRGNQLAVGYTSVSIALATFIGILTYHIFQQLRHTKLWKKVPKLNLEFNRRNIVEVANVPADNLAAKEDFSHLREPLLEDLSQPNYGAF